LQRDEISLGLGCWLSIVAFLSIVTDLLQGNSKRNELVKAIETIARFDLV